LDLTFASRVAAEWVANVKSAPLAFHVSNKEFDAILARIKKQDIAIGSAPWSLRDGKLNHWNGGRGLYFEDINGHVLELMTVAQ
jgi:hypothetical protein